MCIRDSDEERHAEGQEGQAGLEWVVPEHVLEELREEEEHPEHAGHEEEPRHVRGVAAAVGKESQRCDRLRGAPLDGDEQAEQHHADRERADGQHLSLIHI